MISRYVNVIGKQEIDVRMQEASNVYLLIADVGNAAL